MDRIGEFVPSERLISFLVKLEETYSKIVALEERFGEMEKAFIILHAAVNVQGQMDCRQTTRDGKPGLEWSRDGNAEMGAAQGRGWAVVKGDELHGMIFFHGGDDSEFVAKKTGQSASKPKKPKR